MATRFSQKQKIIVDYAAIRLSLFHQMGMEIVVNILVTGAHGFIGTHVCAALEASGHKVIACVRHASAPHHTAVGDIATYEGWQSLLQGVEVVIHLAARVHQVKDTAHDPDAAFYATNVQATERLLRAAEMAGVQHFIFFSSIAVMGVESGNAQMPVTTLRPATPYGRSKAEAEALVQASNIPSTIIRIPLVYGAGVRANFLSLIKAVDKGVPLPFAMVKNARNFLYVQNLTDAMLRLIRIIEESFHESSYPTPSPMGRGTIILLADRETPSMPALIRTLADALGKSPRLLPMPPALLRIGAAMLGKTSLYHQCCSSLVMDTTPTNAALQWNPPYTLQQGIEETIAWYRTSS